MVPAEPSSSGSAPPPSPRTRARKRAVDVLYEAEMRGISAFDAMANRQAVRAAENQPPLHAHTVALVEGVAAHRERIDELLSTYSKGWTLDRMPAVDRTILRIGAYELLWVDDVPDAVAVSEAVDLAHQLSTDESPAFVNGLLGRLQELKPTLAL